MRRLPAVAVVVLAGSLLAGCSTAVAGTGRPGPAIASTKPFGVKGADGTEALGQVVTDVENAPHGFLVTSGGSNGLTVSSRYQGDDGSATLTVDGAECELVAVARDAWAKAPASFWTATDLVTASVARQIADRWVALSGPIAALSTYVDAYEFFDLLEQQGDPELGAVAVRKGERVQVINVGDVRLTVSLASPHRIVRAGDDLVFTYPDDDLHVEVPTGAIALPAS